MTEADLTDLSELASRTASALGLPEVEAYRKRGRSRRLSVGVEDRRIENPVEEGWAIRAGGESGSVFWCGSGPLPRRVGEAGAALSHGAPLSLPMPDSRVPAPRAGNVETAEGSLANERTLVGFHRELEEELGAELPGASLVSMIVDDGVSSSRLANTHGLETGWRNRATLVRVEARRGNESVALEVGSSRLGDDLEARSLARRLADILVVRRGRGVVDPSRRTAILSPLVACRLLEGLTPLWCGAAGTDHARRLASSERRFGAEALDIVDDGALEGGLVSAPVDGEGVPTGRRVIVESGRFVAPLVSRRRDPEAPGAVRRPSWREPPRLAPSHLFIRPAPTSPAELLGSVERGHYWLAPVGDGAFDLARDEFALPVCGFSIDGGEARAPIGEALLGGSIGEMLRGIEAVGRDLRFVPRGAVYGAPTLLVAGITVSPAN